MTTVLALLRRAKGIDQIMLARSVGVSQGTLSLVENGLREPSPEIAAKIAEAIGVDVKDLFPGLKEESENVQ